MNQINIEFLGRLKLITKLLDETFIRKLNIYFNDNGVECPTG